MARKLATPCAGGCGKLLWGGCTSLPAGERMCRACRAVRPKRRRTQRAACAEPGCEKRPIGSERCHKHRPGYAERMRAHYREQTHRRRRASAEQRTDITLEYERNLRAKAKRCPLCNVRMVSRPYLPASKELDHIIPLNVGGTHTIGNVRIICRACNARRPYDGSDYEGPVTLWAQVPIVATRKPRVRRPTLCECGAPKRDGRCWSCRPPRVGRNGMTVEQVHARARRAAEMRGAGHQWQVIADALGFKSPGAAYLAAEAARHRAERAMRT